VLLNVVCNPFKTLDHEGVPASAFPDDPNLSRGYRLWVGAIIDPSRTRITRASKAMHAPRQRTFFKFDLSPRAVEDTNHYRHGILHGDIIPADRTTAQAVGVPFRPWPEAINDYRSRAMKAFKDQHGRDPDFSLWQADLRQPATTNPPLSSSEQA